MTTSPAKRRAGVSYPIEPAILTDTTRCTGCEKCVVACKQENGLEERDHRWRGQQTVDGLSSTRFCAVLRQPNDRFVRQQCRHCRHPACVSACLVGAMQKSPEGPVIYDQSLCMGCRYCLVACPYGIPRYDWDRAVPLVRKCTMCYERLMKNKDAVPACVEACPEKATIFGDRNDLLKEAHDRLDTNPGKYVPQVYGEHEVGGTSVLYISDAPLDFLPDLDDDDRYGPLPDRTWASLRNVPPIILGMGGLMLGIHWIIGRRMRVATQAASGAVPHKAEGNDSVAAPQDTKEDDG
jgi:formate dehydrogenase iron-sulfur subunit